MWYAFRILLAVGIVSFMFFAPPVSCPQQTGLNPRDFLKKYAEFGERDIQRVRAGEVVVKLLQPASAKEVAVAGVVRVKATTDFFLREYCDIETFKKAPEVRKIKKLSGPPKIEDFQQLELPEDDLRDLRRCQVGNCNLKLSAEMIVALSPQGLSDATLNSKLRQLLLDYVSSYLKAGNQAMITYADKTPPQSSSAAFREILAASAYLNEYAPDFRESLASFPDDTEPGRQSFLYWSDEKFGLKPVASITHVLVSPRSDSSTWRFIASKQIYASHYFEDSLGLTFLADDDESPTSFWMIYINRSHSDGLTGWFSNVKRAIVASRVHSGMKRNMKLVKQKLELQYANRSQ